MVVGLLSHGALGNAVHRQECLEERDDEGFKFWKFLFIFGGLLGFFCLFVLDCSNAFGKDLVILHTNTPYLSLVVLQ